MKCELVHGPMRATPSAATSGVVCSRVRVDLYVGPNLEGATPVPMHQEGAPNRRSALANSAWMQSHTLVQAVSARSGRFVRRAPRCREPVWNNYGRQEKEAQGRSTRRAGTKSCRRQIGRKNIWLTRGQINCVSRASLSCSSSNSGGERRHRYSIVHGIACGLVCILAEERTQ